jgi:glyoxylate/succinic semialdehyde reductase
MDGISAGQVAVDLSTVYPDTSVEENRNYVQNGLDFLDAPVFGSKNQAAEGRLWIVVGGRRDVFERGRSSSRLASRCTTWARRARAPP